MTTYSDPQDKKLYIAEPLLLPDPMSPEGFRLPTAEEIVLRLLYGWMLLRIQTLCDLSQYRQRTVERALSSLRKQGAIRRLGYPLEGSFADTHEMLYTVGGTPPKRPYSFTPRRHYRPSGKDSYHEPRELATSEDFLVECHPYYVAEVAAWLARNLAARGCPCLAVPEQVLRREYKWCSLNKPREGGFFHTPIPDAWLIYKGFSLRLEVQLSETASKKVRAVCEGSPLNEPLLYVVPEHGPMYQRLQPLLKDYDHLAVVRLWNEEDLAAVLPRHQSLVRNGNFHPWWMRDWYSSAPFAYSVMNPDAAFLFGRTHGFF